MRSAFTGDIRLAISETFIASRITGLIECEHEPFVRAFMRVDTSTTHGDVCGDVYSLRSATPALYAYTRPKVDNPPVTRGT